MIQFPTGELDLSEPKQAWADVKARLLLPDTRSRAVKIGPSGIGDPCDRCVGETMRLRLPGVPFRSRPPGLKAFRGTGMHMAIEQQLADTAHLMADNDMGERLEQAYDIQEIPGYGMIRGTTDYYRQDLATVIDWKSSDRAKIRKYRMNGVPTVYEYQGDSYGLGISNLGLPVRWVSIIFFPADSNNWDDIWQYVKPFDADNARRAFRRATTIWEQFVLLGRVSELASDDDCWRCNRTNDHVTVELGGWDE